MKHVSLENRRLSVANQELERKLRAEKAERMSMGNNSFVSAGMGGGLGNRFGGGGGAAKDILSRSILENSMAGNGNTSIMDIMTGHAAPTMKEIANRSMQMSKPREHSFVSSQKSFFSKKAPLQKMGSKENNNNGGGNVLDDESFSSCSDGGDIKKVDAFSDENSEESDSQDCIVETDSKVKSTGFFHKLRLRDIMKQKGNKKTEVFREGESEEYNSEVDGEDLNLDTPGVNYDILGVRDSKSAIHQPLMKLILRFEELPEDFDEQLTYVNHRKQLQRESDEEWRARVEA